jgi:hypothetical protein
MRTNQRARSVLLALVAISALLSAGSCAQKTAACDETGAQGLISAPGPTFTVESSALPKNWSLIAYGDMRFTDPANESVTNPKVRRWLVGRVVDEHPDALLLSGDIPYDGSVANDYAVYKTETAAWSAAHLRVYPAMGNHELHGAEVHQPKNWWGTFPQLQGRRWYSVQFGNAYILSLDSNLCLGEKSRQQAWIIDQLDHLPAETQFAFISLHHPPVADSILGSSSHNVRDNERSLATLLAAKAPALHAQFIVVAGHIHNYERFYQDGIVYLVSGGGGAKPVPVARTAADLYQDPGFPNYHYIKFVFDGKRLNASMYRIADPSASSLRTEVKDTFTIEEKKH